MIYDDSAYRGWEYKDHHKYQEKCITSSILRASLSMWHASIMTNTSSPEEGWVKLVFRGSFGFPLRLVPSSSFLKQFIMILDFDYLAIHFNLSSPDHIKLLFRTNRGWFYFILEEKIRYLLLMSVDEGEAVAACFWGSGMPWVHAGVMWWQTPSVLCCIHWPFSRKGAVGDLTMNKELFPPVIN